MSRYSSDSDSSDGERYQKRKPRRKSRSSSESSNDSRYSKKRSYKHKRSKGHRSRSRDKYSKSRSRHSREESSRFRSSSSSRGKHKTSRDKSRSSSRERSYRERSRSRNRSGKQGGLRSKGQSKYRSSSSSSSKARSRSQSQSPSSFDSRTVSQAGSVKQETNSEEQLRAKLQQAIKAAQSADNQLRQQGFLTGVSTRKDDVIKEPTVAVLDEINSASFVPKTFVSVYSLDVPLANTQHSKVQDTSVEISEIKDSASSIFHASLMVDSELKLDKWVKKLFHLRQKAVNGEPIV